MCVLLSLAWGACAGHALRGLSQATTLQRGAGWSLVKPDPCGSKDDADNKTKTAAPDFSTCLSFTTGACSGIYIETGELCGLPCVLDEISLVA